MATRFLNHFGIDINDHNADREPLPYIIDEQDDVTYICFFNTPRRAIHRVTDGKVEVAYGAWADRATLDYGPVNELLTVEE